MGRVTQRRQAFLDVLRVLATMAVVLMHAVSGVLNGGYDFTGWDRRVKAFHALVDVCAVSVPVFLMISGYLFLDPKREITWKDALFRYCRRILLALLVFGIPFSLLEQIMAVKGFSLSMLPTAVWHTLTGRSWSHLWYLYLILILYALTPALKWFLAKYPNAATWGVMLLILLGSSLIPYCLAFLGVGLRWPIPNEFIYLFYYLCGYVFVTKKGIYSKRNAVTCFAAFLVLEFMAGALRFEDGYRIDMAYANPLTVFASILLFAGIRFLWEDKEAGKAVTFLSPLCFGVYLIHPVFLNFCYKFLHVSIMDFRFFIGVPLFFLIAYVGALIGAWILRKIPVFRKYIL